MARNDTRNVTTARGVAGGYLFSAPRTAAVLATIHTLCTHLRDLPSDFVNLGYIASDGLSESESATVETETDVDGRPTGAARHDRTETVRVRLVEAARHPLSEQHGRENVTVEDGLLTIHHNNLPREHRVYVAELLLKDGRRWRKVIPDGQVTDVGDLALNSRELTGREVTISCNAHTWSTWRGTFTDTVVDVIQLQVGAGEGGDPSDDVTPTGTGRATITTLATSAELVPAWRYGTADYTIETRDPTLTLTATFEDNASSATLTCNGSTQALRNGKPLTVGLGEGRNTISIVSRNERTDVTSVATYRIVATYVPEEGYEPATLASAALSGVTLTPSFSPVAFAYEGVTSARSCTFRLATTSANATIRYRVNDGWTYTIGSGVYSAFSWSEGENEMTVTVTNGDTTCVYSFSVTYEPEQA